MGMAVVGSARDIEVTEASRFRSLRQALIGVVARMRICLFTPTFLPRVGGAELVVDTLARRFQAEGHEAIVLAAPMSGDGAVTVPYRVVRYRKPLWLQYWPERLGRALRQLHRAHPLDVVLAFYGQPTGWAAIHARRATDVPVVLRCPGGDLYRHGKTRRCAHRWRRVVAAYQQADAVVAISSYTEQLIREIAPQPRRLACIPNGVHPATVTAPARRPESYRDTRPFCLCLGNLIPRKGFADAIDAFAQAAPDVAGLQLVIVGTGRSEPALRQRATLLGVADRVHFLGQRTGNDKRWFLQNCAFGIMPSHEEAFGIVTAEFLAAGKPLIYTANSACNGMYEHGVNGYCVPAQDPPAIARAMRWIHGGRLGDVRAVNAARLVHLDWDDCARRYLMLLEQVVNGNVNGNPNRSSR